MLSRLQAWLIGVVGAAGRFGGRRLGSAIGITTNVTAALVPRSAGRLANLVAYGILLFATSDANLAAKALAIRIGGSNQLSLALRGHEMLLRMREVEEARAISVRLDDQLEKAHRRLLASREALTHGDHAVALAALGPPGEDDAAGRTARLDLLRRLGRTGDVLSLADSKIVGFEVAARFRYDSLWDMGHASEAVSAIEPAVTPALRSVDTLRRIRDGYRHRDRSDETVLKRLLPGSADSPDWLTTLLFEFDRVDELVELASCEAFIESLGTSGRLYVARARYISRDFDGATRLLEPLRATRHRWDAEKLLARIELESGITTRTVDRRIRSRRPAEGFDEVAYLGLRQIGRHAEAWSSFLPDADRHRLIEVFGDRADFTGAEYVARRLVLPQGGPGDEILGAAAYSELTHRADQTEAACDPRLYRLLSRSFPSVTFHPCTRRMSRNPPGFCASGQPERAGHVLYEQLDRPLNMVAQTADRVIFGRSLGQLLSCVLPAESYLLPEQDLVERHKDRVSGGIGVVWRSEFLDAVRSIHYLTPDDLAPLTKLQCPIICLQHDASSEERDALNRVFGETLIMLDDLDMRDDFETMAAITSSLDLMVGVGTTITELAGSLGTPSITLYPNRVGAWRRRGVTGDHWHCSMQTAIAVDAQRPEGVVEEALKLIRSND